MNTDVLAKNEVYSAMNLDKPFASYIKTILGKVAVTVWDSALERPTDIILQGNPKNKDEGCIVKVWNEKENAVFKRLNSQHFKKGLLIPYEIPEDVVTEKAIEQSTDDELREIVNSKFLALSNKLAKITSQAVLFRMKSMAEDMDKSAKIIGAIEKRLSDLQADEFSPKPMSSDDVEE